LIDAALADEEGTRLRSEIAALSPVSAPPAPIAAPEVARAARV
jgi:hypothetical protein